MTALRVLLLGVHLEGCGVHKYHPGIAWLNYGCGDSILPPLQVTTGITMASTQKEDHVRDVQRTLDTVFGHVPAARQAFPELAAVHAKLAVHGIKALAEAPALGREEMLRRLKPLVPGFGTRQLQAVVDVLAKIDRRSAQRQAAESPLVSTPDMFASEVPMEAFVEAMKKR